MVASSPPALGPPRPARCPARMSRSQTSARLPGLLFHRTGVSRASSIPAETARAGIPPHPPPPPRPPPPPGRGMPNRNLSTGQAPANGGKTISRSGHLSCQQHYYFSAAAGGLRRCFRFANRGSNDELKSGKAAWWAENRNCRMSGVVVCEFPVNIAFRCWNSAFHRRCSGRGRLVGWRECCEDLLAWPVAAKRALFGATVVWTSIIIDGSLGFCFAASACRLLPIPQLHAISALEPLSDYRRDRP